MMQELYRSLAAYNRWSNEQVCAACGQLDETEYYRDRRAFFGSLHGTLNHLLLTDRVWLGRFVGTPYSFTSLREELYPTLATLQEAREFEDARIVAYIESLSSEAIGAELT
ncbi:DinB family protein [Leptolyngbya sp. FACHB-261]|nr:DinB family protein [Leptolyngbya sp. FACHB-261]